MNLLQDLIRSKLIPSGDSPSPGPTPSGTISIDQNGTYNVVAFAEAEVNVPSEDNLATFLSNKTIPAVNDDSITALSNNVSNFRSIRCPNAAWIDSNFSRLKTGITEVFAPKAVVYTEAFKGCNTLKWIVCEGPINTNAGTRPFVAYAPNLMQLEKVEFTDPVGIGAQTFQGDTHFALLLLRKTAVCPLTNINAFETTPFDSGGSGGTIYIPKALFDHLGDGSALDYKAATNWSTLDGYGTITWAQIEGSIYENAYIDGTPIS